MLNKLRENWDNILNTLRSEGDITEVSFNSWLKPLTIVSVKDNVITLGYDDSDIGLNILKKKYLKPLQICINDALDADFSVNIISSSGKIESDETKPIVKKNNNSEGLEPEYTFDSFVIGDNNNMAAAASLAVAESPATLYNPLFLYGGPGLGKKHLLHAIGNFIADNNPELKVFYVTSETFVNDIVSMIRNMKDENDKANIRNKYREVDVLLIDDIQFIIGKDSSQTEFFNAFNYLQSHNKQIVISSDKPPKEMEILEERMISRFLSGMTIDIQQPAYETRVAILYKKAEELNLNISDEILHFIADNVVSNVRELEGALNKIKLYSEFTKSKIDIEFAKKVLIDFISNDKNNEITPKFIIKTVAEHYELTMEEMISSKRSKNIAYPRQIAMYLCRNLTDVSFEEIGRNLGNRDHTTIKHGVEKIENDIKEDDSLNTTIEILKKKINPS